MSNGVPVIASDRVGAKDIVGNGGMIVGAGNKEKLKETIRLLDEKKIKELRTHIRGELYIKTWECFLEENYKLYKSMYEDR